MKLYKYQLHTHTSPCSECSSMSPAELISALHAGGYQGCVLTNHFYHGNTGIDTNLPWNDFVAQLENDYFKCKKEAERYGLDILFGIEEKVENGAEILCYGLTPKMLYEHPELKKSSCKNLCGVLHNEGVICIQAHPYREHDCEKGEEVLPLKYIDGIEVLNASDPQENNVCAAAFAKCHPELIFTAGADAHKGIRVCISGIETPVRMGCPEDLTAVLKSRNYSLINN